MSLVTFFSSVHVDRSQMTLDNLDNLIETMRERGYPVYEPQNDRIVTRYEVETPDNPMALLNAAREAMLPSCSYEQRQIAVLALDIAELRSEVDTNVLSMGYNAPVWDAEKAKLP